LIERVAGEKTNLEVIREPEAQETLGAIKQVLATLELPPAPFSLCRLPLGMRSGENPTVGRSVEMAGGAASWERAVYTKEAKTMAPSSAPGSQFGLMAATSFPSRSGIGLEKGTMMEVSCSATVRRIRK
jgi:hypothetical protein